VIKMNLSQIANNALTLLILIALGYMMYRGARQNKVGGWGNKFKDFLGGFKK